jgi:CheY-like chemotaxis protein
MAPHSSPRILVVDDHPAVRRGLALLLEAADAGTCIEAGCAEEALELAREARPDLALIEMSGTPRVAFALLGQLRALGIPVLIRARKTRCPADDVLSAGMREQFLRIPWLIPIIHVLRSRIDDWLLVDPAPLTPLDNVRGT